MPTVVNYYLFLLQNITNENNTFMYLSSDDIRAISSHKVPVPVNVEENCNQLMQQILTSSRESFHTQEISYINKSSAIEYSQSMEGETGVISFHVDRCSINEKEIFQRSDHRVSKESLQCKAHLSPRRYEFVIEYQATNSSERRRIRFYFNHVMGMSISGKTLSADICKLPQFERKVKTRSENHREKLVFQGKWDADTSCFQESPPAAKYRTVICLHEETDNLLSKLSRVNLLACALETSLLDDYPTFVPFAREVPHERMPILKDPTLVRATQLAILEVAQDRRSRQDVVFLVKMYKGIEKAFRRLLRIRLDQTNSSEDSHEQ